MYFNAPLFSPNWPLGIVSNDMMENSSFPESKFEMNTYVYLSGKKKSQNYNFVGKGYIGQAKLEAILTLTNPVNYFNGKNRSKRKIITCGCLRNISWIYITGGA